MNRSCEPRKWVGKIVGGYFAANAIGEDAQLRCKMNNSTGDDRRAPRTSATKLDLSTILSFVAVTLSVLSIVLVLRGSKSECNAAAERLCRSHGSGVRLEYPEPVHDCMT